MMRYTKIYLFLILLQLYALLVPIPALAYKTYAVAIIPIVNTAQLKDTEVLHLINTKTRNKFKFPFYEIIPSETVTAAIKETTTDNEPITTKDTMKKLSTNLSADIIIAVELVKGKSTIIEPSPWSFYYYDRDTYVDTDVRIRCYTYSTVNDNYLSLEASESGKERLSVDTSVYRSAERLMNQLTSKLPYERVPKDAFLKENNN